MSTAPYGYCPLCGAPGKDRERRLNGDDTCVNEHKYPSASALREPPTPAKLDHSKTRKGMETGKE
jgi:hypothetical protein